LTDLKLNPEAIFWKNNAIGGTGVEINLDLKPSAYEREGSYEIYLNSQSIIINAGDKLGLIYALNTLKFLCDSSDGALRYSYIYDFPDISSRFVHLVMPKKRSRSKVYDLIDLALLNKFNGVVLQIKDRVSFDSINHSKWSLKELNEIKEYCHIRGLTFILEIKFLTHQEKSVFSGAELINKFTYKPTNHELKLRIKKILEIIDNEIAPDGVHIGFDELHGYRNVVQRGNVQHRLDYEGYFEHLQFLSQLLSDLDLVTYMWADMLLDPNEFSNFTAHGWTGKPEVLKDVPRSVILCDWQYWNCREFESIKFLSSYGHIVIPATWCSSLVIEEYADYVKRNINYRQSAILCTTWPGALLNKRNIIMRKGCNLLTQEDIINFSGKAFW
ncbi:MAG: hypothetical protein O3A79_05325, partial [Candidatus Marinimicrobia bacterium]|nr:hypothetical protein [Candidatus Neomarinimicrobiota bacterium]